VLGQLGTLPKMQRCSVALATRVVQFLAVVAFVDVGPKVSNSKLAILRLLGRCEGEWSKEVRMFATARAAVLATEVLPCTIVASAGEGGQAGSRSSHKGTDQVVGGKKVATRDSPRGRKGGAILLPEARTLLSLTWSNVCFCKGAMH
jgi:hypothetical protein